MAATGKAHRKKKTGLKAEKRKKAEHKQKGVPQDAQRRNPKAFAFQSAGKARGQQARTAEREQRRLHAPMVEQPVSEPPPFVVLVQGPPQVGKSTLIRCLVKHYCRQSLNEVKGPVTVVAGKMRRITFVECPHDLHGMLDAAKFADLVLLLVDASFGFEMETFEFLNLLQVHGFPKVMGVLTHLDGFQDMTQLKKTKKKLKARFWAEIYDGAKLFYLSGIQHGKYLKREVLNLARFISVMKSRPLAWRLAHPYVLADRMEDLTRRELIRSMPHCDREVVLYGWLRGANMRDGQRVHWAGVGDFSIQELDALPDPCPLPDKTRKRGLNDKDRLIYAPMSDLGGLLYDKDAVYIDIPNWKVQYSTAGGEDGETRHVANTQRPSEGEEMVRNLQSAPLAVDEALAAGSIQMFQSSGPNQSQSSDEDDESDQSDDGSDEDEEGEGDGSDWSSDADGAEEEEQLNNGHGNGAGRAGGGRRPREAAVTLANGRVRRAALFAGDVVSADGVSSEEEEEEEEGEEGVENGNDSDDSEGLGGAAQWKQQLGMSRAAPPRDLAAWVYGSTACASANGNQELHDEDPSEGASGDDDGEGSDEDFFVLRDKTKRKAASASDPGAVDAVDSSRPMLLAPPDMELDTETSAALRSRFVTGDWAVGEARAGARPEDQGDSDGDGEGDDGEEVFGDFQDMETGEAYTGGSGDVVTEAARTAIADARAEELRAAKAAKKAAFDSKYDAKGPKGADAEDNEDGDAEPQDKAPKHGKARMEKEETFYDSVKAELTARANKSRAALDALPASARMALEGQRPGAYVRVRLSGVPCELLDNLDPCRPMLLGGLGQSEDTQGVMKIRFKRHRWFPKVLKTRDPLVLSCGWRRWQAMPVYALEDHNRRLRLLKYTPEHMHCMAVMYGPLAPQNTGVVAIQSTSSSTRGWRVSGTGVVLELDAELRVMKKLKLVGTPVHIKRHTAFIQGMFTSQLEASRFEGASIRSVSGVRGTIKKAVRPGGELKLGDGTVRATFEDKLLMSDMVFLRSWVVVDIPRLVNPVTNLLEPQAAVARRPKPIKGAKKGAEPASIPAQPPSTAQQPTQEPTAGPAGAAIPALGSRLVAPQPATSDFSPATRFSGPRPGQVFKLGVNGLGYYTDHGPEAAAAAAAAGQPRPGLAAGQQLGASKAANGGAAAKAGWVGMRTVAALRRELGIGAPRDTDSLYRGIERAPRKFNPLQIPKALQAALPFKTKPKLEPAGKAGARKTLEQRRAVLLEPHEKRAATMLQQLNAIRNDKAVKRRDQQARKNVERGKKQAAETAWRTSLNKERRKDRYREEGQAQKRKELASEGRAAGAAAKKQRKRDRGD